MTRDKPRPSTSEQRRQATRRASNEQRPERGERKEHGDESAERLQKVLAAAGLGSRRKCEELILEGRVEIDGQVVEQLGVKVDPRRQEIRVDGTKLPSPTRRYYLVYKPVGVVCTNRDPAGRTRVIDLVDTDDRLFSVGRLDRSSEGLILLTNDGEFANRLTHPRYGVPKTYRVVVAGHPEPEQLRQLIHGVHLAEGIARAASVRVKKKLRDSTELEVVLNEGKNREIRRVLARIGHKVLRLKRVAIGSVKLADLPEGRTRRLDQREVRALLAESKSQKTAAGQGRAPRKKGSRPTGVGQAERPLGTGGRKRPVKSQHRSGSGRPPRKTPSGGSPGRQEGPPGKKGGKRAARKGKR